ncbi:MAG: hypothetical protein Q4Q06_08275, partial [Bacteroidota bacterium]|nr:hypothetical protein [Bacteroidota bacterium]
MKKIIFLFSIIFVVTNAFAQNFSSVVKDTNDTPIYLANVAVLSKADSSLIVGTTTDSLGRFSIEVEHTKNKFIMVSFIGFKSYIKDLDLLDNVIILENDATYLEAIEIKAQRQLVRLEEGKLVYDAQVIRDKKVVSSAFDVIVELPTLYTTDGNSILMVGEKSPSIIINGKVSTMNYSTLIEYLKALPAEKVKNVEFAPSAPPEWFVGNGPAINVTIEKEKHHFYSGRLGGSYRNYTVNGTTINGSGFFSSPKWDFFVSGNAGYYVNMSRNIMNIRHHIVNDMEDSIYKINSEDFNITRNISDYLYSSVSYKITDSTNVTLDYVGNFMPYKRTKTHSENNLTGDSKGLDNGDNSTHTLSLHYQHSKIFNIGAEYTNYINNYDQYMQYAVHNMPLEDAFDYEAKQRINRVMSYLNINKGFKNWCILLGGQYTYTNNHNNQTNT